MSIAHIDIFATKYVENIAATLETLIRGLSLQTSLHIRSLTNEDIDRCTNDSTRYLFLLCPQWIYAHTLRPLPTNKYFVYQLEQFDKSNAPHIHNQFVYNLLRNAKHVFDYSHVNIDYYPKAPIHISLSNVSYLIPPVVMHDDGGSPVKKDIDVLFCGSINERRVSVFHKMRSYGVSITVARQCFGKTLQHTIRRAKVFLNIRFSDSCILETCRLHEALAVRDTSIVSEKPGTNSDDISIYGQRIHFVERGNIANLCMCIKNILSTQPSMEMECDIDKINVNVKDMLQRQFITPNNDI